MARKKCPVEITLIYGLLTKRHVNMAGYWRVSSLLACLWAEIWSRDSQEKNEANIYPAILNEKAWSIKNLLFDFRGNISRGTRLVVPSGQDSSILPTRVANHSARFGSSRPLKELVLHRCSLNFQE